MTSPNVVHTVAELRAAIEQQTGRGATLGFVPTMGALHEGHRVLMREAKRRASFTLVSIFVNPMQFGPKEDLSRYPRDLEGDIAKCEAENVAVVFAPSVREMYPEGERTRVHVGGLTEYLCGASRPGHFDGVATVVTKLFSASGPCIGVFGRKDYQQLQVIKRFTRDLLLPVEIIGVPTVREADGLALSSRNAFLSVEDRRRASSIPRALSAAVRAFAGGERAAASLKAPAAQALADAGLRVDYVELADPDDLVPVKDGAGARALLAIAAFAGTTRLIDNVVLGEEPGP
ncbi:MAG TPA: pantoate--beta-alanine ligase [Polyangiaceae bacterium]|jgi:pantoate--beta-alanine ligase|nr:pantoate--beta-alanine ligase [Polyangiaceae bacterium]